MGVFNKICYFLYNKKINFGTFELSGHGAQVSRLQSIPAQHCTGKPDFLRCLVISLTFWVTDYMKSILHYSQALCRMII